MDLGTKIAASLREAGVDQPEVAVVLGSGLGAFAESLMNARRVPFTDVDGMPDSSVPGHGGNFYFGMLAGKSVLVQQGRVHLYEGRGSEQVGASVRAFAALGVKSLLLTNAAGCIERDWELPGLMRLTDHLNMQGRPSVRRAESGRAHPYDANVARALDEAAEAEGIQLNQGVYAALLGPSYETPAEIQMLAGAGASAVGMSTALEASVAAAVGLPVGAVSCLSNAAAGISATPLNHEEVVEAGAQVADDFVRLLTAAIERL